jgi:hypothetical protein
LVARSGKLLCSIGAVTGRGGGRSGGQWWAASRALIVAGVAFGVAVAPGCADLEPEVGEAIAACVDADSNPAVPVVFKRDIRPIMRGDVPGPKPCANCHYRSRGTKEGLNAVNLDLETLGTLRKGGINTANDIVIPGQPCKSAIVNKLRGTYDGARMPRGGPYWTHEQIQLMADWIFEGAQGADDE